MENHFFFHRLVVGGWFQDDYCTLNLCALYFYCYYIVIYKEFTQLTVMQSQWEPLACFPATRMSHLGSSYKNS